MKTRILIVGLVLRNKYGLAVCEEEKLVYLLNGEGFECFIVSRFINPFTRAIDILYSYVVLNKKFDKVIVMVYSGKSFYFTTLVSILSRIFKKETIYHVHGGNIPAFVKERKKLFDWTLKKHKAVVVPSEYLRNSLLKLGFPSVIIPNIINVNDYVFRKRIRPVPKLLWMRSFNPIYNPFMAIDVLGHVLEEFPDARLTMGGMDHGYEEITKTYADESGLSTFIDFVGFMDDQQKDKYSKTHDFFLNTTRIDNQPVSVIEAMAYGYVIVSTNVGGVPYLIQDEVNGYLIPSEDAISMAQIIIELINHPKQVEIISLNARKHVESMDWKYTKELWYQVLE